MQQTTAQLLAALMAFVHGGLWILVSRWERSGRRARLTARYYPPGPVRWGGDLAQVVPLLCPVVVVVAPGWGYQGPLNWSSGIDPALQGVGLGLWVVGLGVVLWAARALGRYMGVDGVAVNHELVTSGPYRYVRHPVYGSSTAIAVGIALVFRSYLLLGVAGVWIAASLWWADAEEELLASSAGLGEAYRAHVDRTGRFLPRIRRTRR